MLEVGKIVFGVVSLIMMYNILNIELPPFLKSIKENDYIIKIFSFYYVYDLTQNVSISLFCLLIIELSRTYQNNITSIINKNKDNLKNNILKKKGIEKIKKSFFLM